MAGRGKGKEVALQIEVDSQEDWEEVIGKEGLTGISEIIQQQYWEFIIGTCCRPIQYNMLCDGRRKYSLSTSQIT